MEIWTLLNSKGGVGKTTMATNIAHALVNLGHTVCLVDADPQRSVIDWHEMGACDLFPVVSMHTKQALKMLKSAIGTFDYVIIDTPGKLADSNGIATVLSDKIFIPVQPSQYDVWATHDILEMIKERQEITSGRPFAAFIISRAIKNTILSKEVTSILNEYELPVLSTPTINRVSYATSASQGQTVFHTNDAAAQDEIMKLTKEMLDAKIKRREDIDVFS